MKVHDVTVVAFNALIYGFVVQECFSQTDPRKCWWQREKYGENSSLCLSMLHES
jgi:hypothetical protein